MPLVNKSFSDIITLTRLTGGGRTNAQGQYEWLPANTPRIDYDPVTGECLGLLIEEQRTNLLKYSSDFANAVWIKAGSSVAADAVTAPDGTLTADKLVESAANSQHSVQPTLPLVSGTTYTMSVFVKKAERNFARLATFNGLTVQGIALDFNTGEVQVTNGTPTSFGAQYVGAGWWRVWIVSLAVSSTPTPFASISASTGMSLASATYTGDGTSGIYIWGAQLEAGSFPTSYIPTTDAQVTRAADIASVNELSPWYNASEGTLFVEWSTTMPQTGRNVRIAGLFGTNDANRVDIHYPSGTGRVVEFVVSGGTISADITAGTTQSGEVNKIAASYKENDFGVSLDGAAPVKDSAGAVPSAITRLVIGGYRVTGLELNGHIRSIRYYRKRLPDDDLQTMTK